MEGSISSSHQRGCRCPPVSSGWAGLPRECLIYTSHFLFFSLKIYSPSEEGSCLPARRFSGREDVSVARSPDDLVDDVVQQFGYLLFSFAVAAVLWVAGDRGSTPPHPDQTPHGGAGHLVNSAPLARSNACARPASGNGTRGFSLNGND